MNRTSPFLVALGLLISFAAHALDIDRVAQLEREVQELKQRIAKLEAQVGATNQRVTPPASSDGWKSVANWRRLKVDMDADAVRAVLGEPQRISGGGVAIWYYENGGSVTFVRGELSSWSEPTR